VQLVGAMGQRSSMTHIIDVFRGSLNQQVCTLLAQWMERKLLPGLKCLHVVTTTRSACLTGPQSRYLLVVIQIVLHPMESFSSSNQVLTISVLLG
jgi:hypothetical protein